MAGWKTKNKTKEIVDCSKNCSDLLREKNVQKLGLNVSKSRKQFMVSSIFPKNKRWFSVHKIILSVLGRIEDTIICFQDCLTFTNKAVLQVDNYEILLNFFHISHNLTWYSVIVHKFTRIYLVCSIYVLTKQVM